MLYALKADRDMWESQLLLISACSSCLFHAEWPIYLFPLAWFVHSESSIPLHEWSNVCVGIYDQWKEKGMVFLAEYPSILLCLYCIFEAWTKRMLSWTQTLIPVSKNNILSQSDYL